jgi:hypothetical protein
VVAIGGCLLLAVHLVVLHRVASRLAVPVGATVLVGVLIVAKHAGLFRALHDRFRR